MNLRVISFCIAIFILPVSVLAGQVFLDKQRDISSAKPGEVITYFIAYQNPGTQTLNEVTIIDVIPQNTIFQEASGTNTTVYYGYDGSNNFGTSSTLPVTKVKWVVNSSVEAEGKGTVSVRVKIK